MEVSNDNIDFVSCENCSIEVNHLDQFYLHKCFAITCHDCVSNKSVCNHCNLAICIEHCIQLKNKPKCQYHSECGEMAGWTCVCIKGKLCNQHFKRIHGNRPARMQCNPINIIDADEAVLCDDCNSFIAEYKEKDGHKFICFPCYMAHGEKSRFLLNKDLQLQRFDATVRSKFDEAMELESTNNIDILEKINAIANFNKQLIKEIKQQLDGYQWTIERYFNEIKAKLNDNDVNSILETMTDTQARGMKTLRYACVNDMIPIEQCLKTIESWPLSVSKYNFKVPLIHHSTSGSYALDGESSLSVSIVKSLITEELCNMVKERLSITNKMETSFDEPIGDSISLEASMSDNTNTSMSSVTSNDQVLYICNDSKAIVTKLTIFRCPFWFFAVDPEKMEFRANVIEKINGNENQNYKRLIDVRYAALAIVKDAFGPNVLMKRALIRSVRNNTAYVNFIDYGNNCQVEKKNLFEYPEDIKETESTVMLLKLMNVTPMSNFIFLDNEKEKIAKYVDKNLRPRNDTITIERKWISSEGTFCNVTSQIDGQHLNWSESLIRAKLVKKCTFEPPCFIPIKNFCYKYHGSNKSCNAKHCQRAHSCPYCDNDHALKTCIAFKSLNQ